MADASTGTDSCRWRSVAVPGQPANRSDFTYTQSYPYDEAQFATSDTLMATKMRIGFNIGGDAAFFFTRQVGIGVKVAMSRTTLVLPIADDREAAVEAGGLMTGIGLRLRF